MQMENETPRTFNAFTKFQMRLVGVDSKDMEGCPQRDIDMVATLFWVMVGVWFWQSLVFTLTLHMVLANDGHMRAPLVFVGVLLATIILLYDSYGIMMPSWTAHGLEELRRGGIDLQVPLGQKIANNAWLALRLMAAVVTSIMITLFCSLQVFERDIVEENLRFAREQNKDVMATAEARFNKLLSDVEDDRSRLTQNRQALIDEESQLMRRMNGEVVESDTEIGSLSESLKRLEAEKSEAENALRQAEDRAANELGGARTSETTGIAGNGPRAQAARQRVQVARRALDEKSKELNQLRARINNLHDQQRNDTTNQAPELKARLASVRNAKEEIEAKLKENTDRRAALIADHGNAVSHDVASDPTRAEALTGFLGKVKALWRLSADPVIGFVTTLFDIFFFAIEMAAVVSKLATFVPSTYATRLARKEHFRAALEAQMLARDLQNLSDEYDASTLELEGIAPKEGEEGTKPASTTSETERSTSPPAPEAPKTPPPAPDFGKAIDIFNNRINGKIPPKHEEAKPDEIKPEPKKPGNGQMPLPGVGMPRKRGRPPGSKNRPAPEAPL